MVDLQSSVVVGFYQSVDKANPTKNNLFQMLRRFSFADIMEKLVDLIKSQASKSTLSSCTSSNFTNSTSCSMCSWPFVGAFVSSTRTTSSILDMLVYNFLTYYRSSGKLKSYLIAFFFKNH